MSGADDTDGPPTAARPLVEPAPPADGREKARVLAHLDWVTVVQLAVGVLLAWALFGLFGTATDAVTKIAIGSVLALALDPVVVLLQRRTRWPRGAAVAVVCATLLLLLTAVLAVLGPPAVSRSAEFSQELPETVEDLYSFPIVGGQLRDADAATQVDEWLDELPGTISEAGLIDFAERLVGGLVSIVQVLLVTFAVLFDGERIVARLRRAFPERHRGAAVRAGRIAYRILGRYFAGSMLLAVMNGVYILAVGLALGVPLVPLAAIWVMLTNLIPQVGGFLGGFVFVTLALTAGVTTGLLALVFFVVYMSGENYLIQPAVVGTAVDLSPPVTMLAAFVGAATAGVPGALVTTPLVGAVKAMYLEARFGDDSDDEPAGDGDADEPPDGGPAGHGARSSRADVDHP